MGKYSEEFKRQLVEEYHQGSIGYDKLAKKYGMPASSLIRRWVNAFRDLGQSGLTPKQVKTAYSVQFKRDVLHFIKQTGASHQEAASHFGLNNSSLITSWNLSRENLGMEGLKEKLKGRPSMSKHSKKKSSKLEKNQTQQALERENELLRLENAYLKKLKAFRADPEEYLEKHKQRWHSNSKKNSE